MSEERWFPIDYETSSNIRLRKLLAASDDWQLYSVGDGERVLTCTTELGDRWINSGILDSEVLEKLSFGVDNYRLLESGSNQQLAPITEFISPKSKADAAAFAVSLKNTRDIINDVSFHDAIYVERLSRLLPTWTISDSVSDERILGCWLTGGVSVSASSYRRITSLVGWLGNNDIQDIIALSGLGSPQQEDDALSKVRRKEDTPLTDTEDRRGLSNKKAGADEAEKSTTFQLKGRPYLEEFINEHIVDIIQNEDRYKALGVDFPSAIVLHGPPGCGKTYAVERLTDFLDWPAYHIDSNSIGSPYIHETSRKVAEVFEKAIENSPSVIVIDEMEAFLSDRQLSQSSGLHRVEEVAEFLRRIPEAVSNRVLIVGMTNRLEMIDQAILRRGRFDHIIEVGMPSKGEVTELITDLISKMPVESELSIEKAISNLEGRPLSDSAFAIREAGRLAARMGKTSLDQNSLDTALAKLPNNNGQEKSNPVGFIWN